MFLTMIPSTNQSFVVIGSGSDEKYSMKSKNLTSFQYIAVSSEAWAKLRDWSSVAGRGRLLLSGSVAHASLKTAVCQNMAANKSFLYLNISQSYRNYAMSYMTPTYPENIRLVGPSSWEEMRNQNTTDRPQDSYPLLSHICAIHFSVHFYSILSIFYTQASLRSAWINYSTPNFFLD